MTKGRGKGMRDDAGFVIFVAKDSPKNNFTFSCVDPSPHGCVARRLNSPAIRPFRALPYGRLDT